MVILFLLIYACGGGGDSTRQTSSGTGSLSFHLDLQPTANQHAMSQSPNSDICEDFAIDTVDATVEDASDNLVASASWPCSAHQGTIDKVPAGTSMTLIVTGIVAGNPDWKKQTTDISVSSGQDTNIGRVVLRYVGDDTTAPTISGRSPDPDFTGVSIHAAVTVSFNEEVVPASVNTSTFTLESDAGPVSGSITYDGSALKATFTPDSPLSYNTTYTSTVTDDVMDRAGNKMAGDDSWSFTTNPLIAVTDLELVARIGNQLHQFYREHTTEKNSKWTYAGPIKIEGESEVNDAIGNPVLIQSSFGTNGNFELVYPSTEDGIIHLYRDNDNGGAQPPWYKTGPPFGADFGVDGLTMIQSNYVYAGHGNLEIIARVGNELRHFFRSNGWYDAGPISTTNEGLVGDAAGDPVLIQSSFGTNGNFELVYPSTEDGIIHLYRDNDEGGTQPPWYKTGPPFGADFSVDGLTMIQSSYTSEGAEEGDKGHLEVVARIGNQLRQFFRRDVLPLDWIDNQPIMIEGAPVNDAGGNPVLIQSRFGEPGNFELVYPSTTEGENKGGIVHLSRKNDADGYPWVLTEHFGEDLGKVDAVTMIQNYSSGGF
jgi:hypothetical protein